MTQYSDLSQNQKEVVDRAIELLSSYESLDLEQLEPEEMLKHKNFRRTLKNKPVNKGNIEQEKLESYIQRGILEKDEQGNLKINSLWHPRQLKTLEENQMFTPELQKLYKNQNDEVEKSVYGGQESYQTRMKHGKGELRLKFDQNIEEESKKSPSNRKIEKMIASFIAEAKNKDDKEKYIKSFKIEKFLDDDSPYHVKPNENIQENGGVELMTDYEQFANTVENVREVIESIESRYEELPNDELDSAMENIDDEISTVKTYVSNLEAYLSDAQNDVEELSEAIHRYEETFEKMIEGLEGLTETLSSYEEDFSDYLDEQENLVNDLEDSVDELQGIGASVSYDGPSDDVMDAVEETLDDEKYEDFTDAVEQLSGEE